MKLKLVHVVLAMALCAAGLWWWTTRDPAANAVAATGACPLPLPVAAGSPPLQTDAPPMAAFSLAGYSLKPLAGFSIDARVLSREDYSWDREAALSPTDLALGWGRMADDDVLSRLSLSQGGRFFRYAWRDQPPLDPVEIVRSASNMHMIPANHAIARTLKDIRRDDRVRIDGWLVQADASDGWRWRSSLSRNDSGAGACEVVYVCSIARR